MKSPSGSDGNRRQRYAQAMRELVAAWIAADTMPVPQPKPTTGWCCTNRPGVNLRTTPNMNGKPVRTIGYGVVVEVGLVKTDGDVVSLTGYAPQ